MCPCTYLSFSLILELCFVLTILQLLSDDWTKSLHLQSDRSLELHNQGGMHTRVRLPRFGRALAYHYPSADALVGAVGQEVYRLNLDQGRFLSPYAVSYTHL